MDVEMHALIQLDPSGLEELAERAADQAVNKLLGRLNLESNKTDTDFMTNKMVMEYLGLSRATLQRYRKDGRLLFSKTGRKVFYRRSDVQAMLEGAIQ